MHAAVVSSFDTPPRYESFPTPEASTDHEVVVSVVACGLHPRVRSQADGSHYTSTSELPLIPGIDGVGRTTKGEMRYFILPDTTLGAMAEKTVIDLRRSIVLPENTNAILVAAAMNPAMSSWIALRKRIDFTPGSNVVVLGATGNAGHLAVQIARHLGAGRVVAAGRDHDRLSTLLEHSADEIVSLHGNPVEVADRVGEAARETDVVIDYLWGQPTADAMRSIVTGRLDPSRPLTWIQIGSVAGPTADVPSALLRSCRLQIVGSGQGSISTGEILAELPELAARITDGSFTVNARTMPLTDVEQAWNEPPQGRERIVITP
jgi:NADPH:quinone reductase-like Zn-dependent oxidoreductase